MEACVSLRLETLVIVCRMWIVEAENLVLVRGMCVFEAENLMLVWRMCIVEAVHPQNVRFQNVRFQNVRFQNVWNVRFTKRQVCKTWGLENVRFTKRQVFKMSRCKKTSKYILYLWLVEIRRFCCSHVCWQSDGCVLFSIWEGFFAIYHHNR